MAMIMHTIYLCIHSSYTKPVKFINHTSLSSLQKLVYYQSTMIPDYHDIRCPSDSEHHPKKRLILIDVKSQCSSGPPLLSSLDILNITLALLLLLLIINFLHNFYQYRRHGKLPWIIIRMPCCWGKPASRPVAYNLAFRKIQGLLKHLGISSVSFFLLLCSLVYN